MNRNVTATILIILAIGIYFTVTEGMWTDTNSWQATNDQYTKAIGDATKLLALRDKANEQMKNISSTDQENLDKMLPNTVDNIRLIIDLNSVAMKHGFALKNIKAGVTGGANKVTSKTQKAPVPVTGASSVANAATTIPVPTLDTVTVSFGVTAPYLQFRSFLQDLEADLRIIDLSHLSISANDSGTYDFNVEMKTYWLRQQ